MRWSARIFAISWLSYFSYYFTRKNFSVIKSSLPLSAQKLAWIDLGQLIGYMVGQFANGVLCELIGPRLLVTIGMLISAVMTVLFAVSDSFVAQITIAYIAISVVNGFVQASGWPGNARLMASWFSPLARGQIMGFWSTSYQAGGLAATWLAGQLLGIGSWQTMYLVMAAWVAMVGLGYWALARNQPSDVGLACVVGNTPATGDAPTGSAATQRRAAYRAIFTNPMTYAFGVNYFALKLMRYGFLLWMPYYLNKSFGYDKTQSATMSIAFELGGIPFSIIAGLIADRLLGRRRVLVACVSAFMLVGALYAYRTFAKLGPTPNFLLLMAVGATLFACDTLISGSASQDLGGPDAAGLACGVVNGIGSIGAVTQAIVLVPIANRYGWDAIFTLFQWSAVLGAVALLPYIKVRPAPT